MSHLARHDAGGFRRAGERDDGLVDERTESDPTREMSKLVRHDRSELFDIEQVEQRDAEDYCAAPGDEQQSGHYGQ